MAGEKAPRRTTDGLFKQVCSTDLLFLIDTTASMGPHINAAKEQVKSIVHDIKEAFLNEADIRVAVVGYKDHMDHPSIQFLDFTPSTDEVHDFLDKLSATGGCDTPEDVLGGIRQALNAAWRQQTRCIIHIADAPPHGKHLHDLSEELGLIDSFPIPGTEPHNLTYEPLLKQMVGLKINYALLRINKYTDRMAFRFMAIYAEAFADCKLLPANRYHFDASELLESLRSGGRSRGRPRQSRGGALQFEEAELGTTYSALRHLVVKSVTSSISRTAVRLSGSVPRSSKTGGL